MTRITEALNNKNLTNMEVYTLLEKEGLSDDEIIELFEESTERSAKALFQDRINAFLGKADILQSNADGSVTLPEELN